MIDLFLSRKQDCSFPRTAKKKKKSSNHSKNMKDFKINRGSNIFIIKPDTFCLKDFAKHQLGNYKKLTFNLDWGL